jgi:putative tricarboxylic transport membrane protein
VSGVALDLAWAIGSGLVAAVFFSAVGLIGGTDETGTIVPPTLLVILLGVPPAGVIAFFLAAVMAKHLTHAVPTTLLGLPGDTMAVPLLEEAGLLRRLGVPHIALRKIVAGGVVASFIAVPVSIGVATLIAPFAGAVMIAAPWLFLVAALLIAYFSPARWAAVAALVPFVVLVLAANAFGKAHGAHFSTVFFLGIATGPMIFDLCTALSPISRERLRRDEPQHVRLAPDTERDAGWLPNPLRVLDRSQLAWVAGTSAVTSVTFMFSPVATTVAVGEFVKARLPHSYQRLTTTLAVRNGVTQATYLGETLIPLVAFGLPLSPMGASVAAPLFNAPPRYTAERGGHIHNLHTLLSPGQFLLFGLVALVVATLVGYPLTMRYAHRAASWVSRRISHETVVIMFSALLLVISAWEGGVAGVAVALTVALLAGALIRALRVPAGVLFMGYYVAILSLPALLAL